MSESKIQVTLVASEYPPNIAGGLGVHVSQMTAVSGGQVDYDLFLPRYDRYHEPPIHIRIHEVDTPEGLSEFEFWVHFCHAAVSSTERFNISPQLIHCHDWMTILAGIRLRQKFKVPLIFNVHLPEHIGSRMLLENIGLASADLVLVNSNQVRKEMLARKLPIRQIEVVPNGVDSMVFVPGTDQPGDDAYIFFAGRLVSQKGVDVLLRAYAVVLHNYPEIQLVIAGDGDLELYFKRMVRYLGIPHRVRFVGWQTGPALVNLYQKARVVVVPSYYEPFGIVALEAMSCGRPVIASRLGGLSELIEDGIQGYLFQPGDYLQLARLLSNCIRNPELCQKMGVMARKRASKYSWHAAAMSTIGFYRNLIGYKAASSSGKEMFKIIGDFPDQLGNDMKHLFLDLLNME